MSLVGESEAGINEDPDSERRNGIGFDKAHVLVPCARAEET